MRYTAVTSKVLHALGASYAVYRSGTQQFTGSSSVLLYTAEFLDEEGLWGDAVLHTVMGAPANDDLVEVLKVLEEVNIYGWWRVRDYLIALARLAITAFEGISMRLDELLPQVVGTPLKVRHIIDVLTYAPSAKQSSVESIMIPYLKDGYAVTFSWVDRHTTPQMLIDSVLRALLDRFLPKKLHLSLKVINEVLDALAPNGYLSHALGLTQLLKTPSSKVEEIVRNYFLGGVYKKERMPEYLLGELLKR